MHILARYKNDWKTGMKDDLKWIREYLPNRLLLGDTCFQVPV